VSVTETHGCEAALTAHPVELGSDISDHYHVAPASLQLTGIISDTPIQTGFPGQTLIESVSLLNTGAKTPSKAAWETLKGYFDNAEVISIETSLQKYDDMVLTNFSVTRDAKTGQVLSFSCAASKVRIVTTEITDAISLPKPKQPVAAKKSTKGSKPKKTAPEKNISAAAKLADKAGSFFGI
jgi:hypothetical protein